MLKRHTFDMFVLSFICLP